MQPQENVIISVVTFYVCSREYVARPAVAVGGKDSQREFRMKGPPWSERGHWDPLQEISEF